MSVLLPCSSQESEGWSQSRWMLDGPCGLRRVHIASSHSAASIWASGRTRPWTSQRYRGNQHQRDSAAVGGESRERSALAFAEAGTSPLAVSLPDCASADANCSQQLLSLPDLLANAHGHCRRAELLAQLWTSSLAVAVGLRQEICWDKAFVKHGLWRVEGIAPWCPSLQLAWTQLQTLPKRLG